MNLLSVLCFGDAFFFFLPPAGLDASDLLSKCRRAHQSPEGCWAGVNLEEERVDNMLKLGIVEPKMLFVSAVKSAQEAAQVILRIDHNTIHPPETPFFDTIPE
jgi:chaperonin GroEL (HSP60 family)